MANIGPPTESDLERWDAQEAKHLTGQRTERPDNWPTLRRDPRLDQIRKRMGEQYQTWRLTELRYLRKAQACDVLAEDATNMIGFAAEQARDAHWLAWGARESYREIWGEDPPEPPCEEMP